MFAPLEMIKSDFDGPFNRAVIFARKELPRHDFCVTLMADTACQGDFTVF